MTQDDETPLADWPHKKEPKAGDPEVNRARDAKHYAGNHPGFVLDQSKPPQRDVVDVRSQLPVEAPVMQAFLKFQKTEGYAEAIVATNESGTRDESLWKMFLAGWSARDSQP